MTCRWKPGLGDDDESLTEVKKMSEASLDRESEYDRALRREVRRLKVALSKLEDKRLRGEKNKCSRCLLSRCNGGDKCPANTRRCNRCRELGHYGRSTLCKGVRKVQEENPSKHEMVAGVIREGEQDSRIRVSLGMTRQGDSAENQFTGGYWG